MLGKLGTAKKENLTDEFDEFEANHAIRQHCYEEIKALHYYYGDKRKIMCNTYKNKMSMILIFITGNKISKRNVQYQKSFIHKVTVMFLKFVQT